MVSVVDSAACAAGAGHARAGSRALVVALLPRAATDTAEQAAADHDEVVLAGLQQGPTSTGAGAYRAAIYDAATVVAIDSRDLENRESLVLPLLFGATT